MTFDLTLLIDHHTVTAEVYPGGPVSHLSRVVTPEGRVLSGSEVDAWDDEHREAVDDAVSRHMAAELADVMVPV